MALSTTDRHIERCVLTPFDDRVEEYQKLDLFHQRLLLARILAVLSTRPLVD